MSTHDKTSQRATRAAKGARSVSDGRAAATHEIGLPAGYSKAQEFLQDREYEKARGAYARLARSTAMADPRLRALVQKDLAAIAALEKKRDEAHEGPRQAIASDAKTDAKSTRPQPTAKKPPPKPRSTPKAKQPLASRNPEFKITDQRGCVTTILIDRPD